MLYRLPILSSNPRIETLIRTDLMIYLSSGEPNQLERSRDRSYSVFVYLGVEEQKVNCVFFIVYRTCMCVELVRFRVEHNVMFCAFLRFSSVIA